jgi:hypothetical protein
MNVVRNVTLSTGMRGVVKFAALFANAISTCQSRHPSDTVTIVGVSGKIAHGSGVGAGVTVKVGVTVGVAVTAGESA